MASRGPQRPTQRPTQRPMQRRRRGGRVRISFHFTREGEEVHLSGIAVAREEEKEGNLGDLEMIWMIWLGRFCCIKSRIRMIHQVQGTWFGNAQIGWPFMIPMINYD